MDKKFAFIFLIWLSYLPNFFAQINIGFTQSDWLDSLWSGDLPNFTVLNEKLQLQDLDPSSANHSYVHLFAPTSFDSTTYWYLDWRMDFSPSTSNYSKLWLCSSLDNGGIIQGYYLRMGGYSGSSDALKLFYYDGESDFELASSADGYMHGTDVRRELKVERSNEGIWTIQSRIYGESDFHNLFEVYHNSGIQYDYVSFECIYTVSRNEHFYLDSIYLAPVYIDQLPPQLIKWEYAAGPMIRFEFDEDISFSDPVFYLDAMIYDAEYSIEDNQLSIYTEANLTQDQYFSLMLEGIEDAAGNKSSALIIESEFEFIDHAKEGAILFSEVFYEPSYNENPLAPDWEFIELFNRSDYSLDLEGLYILYNGIQYPLKGTIINPKSYIVLCPSNEASVLEGFEYLEDFPSLSNTGGLLELYGAGHILLDRIYFSPSQYQDEQRDKGGYSLERINLNNLCLTNKNWKACQRTLGTSPGMENSVYDSTFFPLPKLKFNTVSPDVQSITIESDYRLQNDIPHVVFETSPSLPITGLTQYFDQTEKIDLFFSDPIISGVEYMLYMNDSIKLCNGQDVIDDLSISFGKGKRPNQGDVLINEIMPDPLSGCSSFIELVNNSDSLIDGTGLFIEFNSVNQRFVFPLPLSVINKDAYPVFFRDSSSLTDCYPTLDYSLVWISDAFKSINQDSFTLNLLNLNDDFSLDIISKCTYNINERGDIEGVRGKSFERISNSNWLSAPAPNYSSPTKPNQEVFLNNSRFNQPFALDPPLLSGEVPFFNLIYNLGAKVSNFDVSIIAAGIPKIHSLESSLSLSGSGNLLIDTVPREKMKSGVYIMLIEEIIEGDKQKRWLIPFFVYL